MIQCFGSPALQVALVIPIIHRFLLCGSDDLESAPQTHFRLEEVYPKRVRPGALIEDGAASSPLNN